MKTFKTFMCSKSRNGYEVWYGVIGFVGIIAAVGFGTALLFCSHSEMGHPWYQHFRIILFYIIFAFIWFPFNLIAQYKTESPKGTEDSVKLKYKQFIDMYNVNPSRWTIWVDYDHYFLHYTSDTGENFYIRFNFFDWIRFKNFQMKREKYKNLEKKNTTTVKMLESVQRDIQRKYNEANETIKKVSSN